MTIAPIAEQRKRQLVSATLEEIGTTGTLDVSVGRIARRAGVSAALAFHYFGDKDRLFLAAMRHILRLHAAELRGALTRAKTPRQRLQDVIRASFSETSFRRDVISAWLNFYVMALHFQEARRLLAVYHRRLHANLTHDLRPLIGERAPDAARRIGGLIDGLYLRAAVNPADIEATAAANHVLAALESELREAP